jgi:RNA polymerase sigma-70 factor (ECF subfamily)
MDSPDDTDMPCLERFRDYLRLLARLRLAKFSPDPADLSQIVQKTLNQARGELGDLRSITSAELAAYLRSVLAANVAEVLRTQGDPERDPTPEGSLERQLDHSSVQLGRWIAQDGIGAGDYARQHDSSVILAYALERLPEPEREAIILHYWQGFSLPDIGARFDCTPRSVAGLLKSALKQLRIEFDALN